MTDHFDDPACPECGRPVRIGLPRNAHVEAVTTTPVPALDETFGDDDGNKRRRNACEAGHDVYVYFTA